MKKGLFTVVSAMLVAGCCCFCTEKAPTAVATSPDGKNEIRLWTEPLAYEVARDGVVVVAKTAIGMKVDGTCLASGVPCRVSGETKSGTVATPVYKKAQVDLAGNETFVDFGDWGVRLAARDDGVAYRFETKMSGQVTVNCEKAAVTIPCPKAKCSFCYGHQYGCEETVPLTCAASEIETGKAKDRKYVYLPFVYSVGGKSVAVTESDVCDYPVWNLKRTDGDKGVKFGSVFAGWPKKLQRASGWDHKPVAEGGRWVMVDEHEDWLVKTEGARTFPWRTFVLADEPSAFCAADIVYALARPQAAYDFSWVKPGKVAWDWWNNCNVYGVDFESGINNDTYKYYIDFASRNGIEYIIMDEGWSVGFEDLLTITPGINLEELIEYGRQREVGIILWAGYGPFQKDIEGACKKYSAMGIKGFKVDFMDSCDQPVVEFHHQAARIAAKYHLMLDFHGTYKPTGLSRTYPNVINYEGIYGLENMKWNDECDQVTYDVIVPYIRFFAGSADYTQGAMRNAGKSNFRAVWDEAMSQGTRCHQLAQYVVYSSPLNMLCDSPSNYMSEPECTQFIAEVPEVWDETVALDGKVAEYAAIARRSGDTWYVGVLNNWDERDLKLKLDFLPDGEYDVTIFKDGSVQVEDNGRGFPVGIHPKMGRPAVEKVCQPLCKCKKLDIHLAQGGGYVAIITKK